jgi:DNA-binding transcriptional MerR regulator
MTNKQAEDFLKEYYANKSNPILWTIKQNTGWSIDEVAEILKEYASQQSSTPSEEEWKEALEARIKNTKANLREAHLIKIGAEWAKKFLNK